MSTTKDAFLARKIVTKAITPPAMDGETVHVRKMTAADSDKLQREFISKGKNVDALQFVVLRCLAEETGERLFDEKEMPKVAALDFDIVTQIATEAMDFSGLQPKVETKESDEKKPSDA